MVAVPAGVSVSHPAEGVGGPGVGGGVGAAERAAQFVGDYFEEEVGAEVAVVVEVHFEDVFFVEGELDVGFVVADFFEIVVAIEGDRLEERLGGLAGERLAEGGGDAGEGVGDGAAA